MLRYQQFALALAVFFTAWAGLLVVLEEGPAREVVTTAPWLALIAFGSYSLFTIGHSLSTFGTCPEASAELSEDLVRIRAELKKRKFADTAQ